MKLLIWRFNNSTVFTLDLGKFTQIHLMLTKLIICYDKSAISTFFLKFWACFKMLNGFKIRKRLVAIIIIRAFENYFLHLLFQMSVHLTENQSLLLVASLRTYKICFLNAFATIEILALRAFYWIFNN